MATRSKGSSAGVGQALDERREHLPFLAPPAVPCVACSRPLPGPQRVERDVTRNPDHPGAKGLPLAEPLVPFEGPAEGVIRTVLDVRVVDRLPDDARDHGADKRPQRGGLAGEIALFSLF